MLKNAANGYGLITRLFHWAMSPLILLMIAIGYWISTLPGSEFKMSLIGLHKSTGLLILFLVVLRILWRSRNVQPDAPDTIPTWQHFLGKANILVMYCLLFLVPITGLSGSLTSGYPVSFYGLFTIPVFIKNPEIASYCWGLHGIIPYVLLSCVVLHFLAAMYNHLILKNTVFLKMWRGN
jgi:cytochrome b561